MKEFDYIIIGGGCAGLSLAYELDAHSKLKDKTLAILNLETNIKKIKHGLFGKFHRITLMTVLKKVGIILQLTFQII